jgi:putative hemolysin
MSLLVALPLMALLCLATFVQTLYLESLRLRRRDLPAIDFFKNTLEEKLGMQTEPGALAFSLLKHTLLVVSGALFTIVAIGSDGTRLLEGILLGFFAMLLSTYVVPQVLYRRTEGRWLLPLVPVLRLTALPFRPLILVLNLLHSLFELSNGKTASERETSPEEEIDALISAGEEEGILHKEDSLLIHQVVAFGDKKVREVMTPRPDIVAISVDKSVENLRELVINEQYSRVPVFEGSIDQIIGFIHVRDMFEIEPEDRNKVTLRGLIRPIDVVPEFQPVTDLLRTMQRDGKHIVYVVDEYGAVSGLVTLEDLVEEVFGEIRDEHEPKDNVRKADDGSVTVAGSYDVDHLKQLFGFRPVPPPESSTVGGLVTEWMGEVPKPGATVRRDGLEMEVLAANDLRVERVRIRPAPPAAEEAAVS